MWFRYSLTTVLKNFSLKSNIYLLIMCFSYKTVRQGCGWLWSIQQEVFFPGAGNALAEQPRIWVCVLCRLLQGLWLWEMPGQSFGWVCDRRKLHLSEAPSRTRWEDRRHWILWELRRAIAVPCISWAVITDLVHALNLLQRQVQIVSSELFHFLCLSWHEAAHWAAVPQTSCATRDKPTIYLLVIQKSPFSA